MGYLWAVHLDWLFFMNGLILFLTSIICLGLHRHKIYAQPWRALFSALFSAGFASFFEMLGFAFGKPWQVILISTVLLTLTCSCFLLFGAFSLFRTKRSIGIIWAYLLVAIIYSLIHGYVFGMDVYAVAVMYLVGMPGGIATGVAFLLLRPYASRHDKPFLLMGGIAIIIYAVLNAIDAPRESYSTLTTFINGIRFADMTGLHVIVVSCIVIALFAASCWRLYPTPPKLPVTVKKRHAYLPMKRMTGVLLLLVLLGSWFFTGVMNQIATYNQEKQMLERARLAIAAMKPRLVEDLTQPALSAKMRRRDVLRESFDRIIRSQNDVRALFLLVNSGESEWRYLVDIQRPLFADADGMRDGSVVANRDLIRRISLLQADEALNTDFSIWVKHDRVTTLIPIVRSPDDPVLSVFGMETDVEEWNQYLALHRLPVMMGSMLVVLLLVGLLTLQYRGAEASAAIYHSESMLSDVISFLPDATFVLDHRQRVIVWNQALEELTGVRANAILGKSNHAYAIPFFKEQRPLLADLVFDDTPFLMENYKNIRKVDDCITAETYIPHLRPGGVYLSVKAKARLDETGRVVGAIESVRDITELRRAHEALQFEEARLEAQLQLYQMEDASISEIVNYALEAGLKLTRSSVGYIAFTAENETVLDMYAWSASAMEQCGVTPVSTRFVVSRTGLWGEPVRKRQAVITNDYAQPNDLKKGLPAGHVPIARHLGVPVLDGDKVVLVAGMGNKEEEYNDQDANQLTLLMTGMWLIVQRKRAERQRQQLEDELRHAQKMEAVGRLAGGVAHDFNNLLLPVLGFSEMLLTELPTDHPHHEPLRQIVRAADQAKRLVTQLLAFGRKQMLDLKDVCLDVVVRDYEPMLRRTLRDNVHLVLDLDSAPARIRADAGQLEQILMNLALNAQDAMREGGVLRISTSRTFPEENADPVSSDESPRVVMTVSDTGVGMDPLVAAQLFEPFFTTKEVGKGTGLGMATVYGIIQQHSGHIEVNSAPGEGATFVISFPVKDNKDVYGESLLAGSRIVGGKEHILLVEDNEMVRSVSCQILRRLGYSVTVAASSRECLEYFDAAPEAYDLLLADVVLHEISGIDLYQTLLEKRADLKVLFMSGYAESKSNLQRSNKGDLPFISKPFTVNALAEMVREALGQAQANRPGA